MVELLFTQALGLTAPWKVVEVKFAPEARRIDFYVEDEGNHACPQCGSLQTGVHDRAARTWRHLDFFQFEAYIHADVPRVKCRQCGKVDTIEVPWARPGSHFTLMFEALMLTLAPVMSVARMSHQLRVRSHQSWRVINHYVPQARAQESFASVTQVGVDETAAKRGQEYITAFYDLQESRLLFATPGRSGDTLRQFVEDLQAHGGQSAQITHLGMDMSAAFQSGARAHLPKAQLCFDRFHVVALASGAVDDVRRAEQRSEPDLKGTRWVLLKDAHQWTKAQWETMAWLQRSQLKTARAWRLKESLRLIYRTATSPAEAEPLLQRWCSWARRCRLEPFKKLARTLQNHWDGILNGFTTNCHNGKVEAMNRALQEARARARGYRVVDNFINMAYLIAGRLKHLPPSPFMTTSPQKTT